MYKILINIITKNKDKWIFYQEDDADYVASSLDDIKDKALELLDEYGEDNVKIVDQRSGDDSKKDIPTYLFGNGTGGTSDYNELENKPKINGVELINNKSLKDLGIIIPSNEDFTLEGLGEKSYNSLDDKPKIPKKVSELENDSKYETVESTDTKIAGAKSYADEAVAHLVGSAPETLDTLEEVAKAIQDNETVVDALNAAIGSKADKSELGTKQDKLTAGDGIDIKDNIISADNNVEFFYNFTTVEAMQKVIDSMRAGKKAMLISKGNNAANKGSGMFEYPIFYSPDVSNIDWDTYSGALYFKSDWWMDSYTDVFHGNEIKLIPKWQYITVSILPGGIVKSVMTNGWSSHNNIPNVMSSLNVLGKTNEVEYTPTKDYHPATKKYVDDKTGDLTTLATEDKSSLVNAINEVASSSLSAYYAEGDKYSTFVTEENQLIFKAWFDEYIKTGIAPNFEIKTKVRTDSYQYHNFRLLSVYDWYNSRIYMNFVSSTQTRGEIYLTSIGIDHSGNEFTGISLNNDNSYLECKKYILPTSALPDMSNYLSKTNTTSYTPTSDYHPATKKYVDDAVVAKQDVLTAGENITIDENNVISSGKTNYLGYIEDYTSDNRLDITDLEKGTYSLGIKDRIGSQTLYLKVSHNGQEQTLDTELQIEPTVVSNMIYFDVRHPIKDISGYDEVIRISFSYLNSITGEIVDTKYGISYNNTSGILSNSARYNTKISAVTTNTEQVIRGKKTFNVLPESSVEPTNDNQFVNKKYVDGNKYELPIASANTLGGIKLGEGLSADENGVVSASGCDIPVYNFKMTSEYHKVTSTVTYVYMSSDDKIALQNIIQNAYDKGLETFALFVNQRVGTYTGTNEMHQDYLLTIVNGKLIKNKPSSLLLAGYSQGNSTFTDVYLSKLNILLQLSWNGDSCTVGFAQYINVELRPLSSDNTVVYVPTSDYNPATKKYVDDQVGNINTVLATLTTVSEVTK